MSKTPLEKYLETIRTMVLKDIETLEDGYKVWWPLHGTGYLNAFDLRAVADILDDLNKDWDTVVQAELSNKP